LDLQVNCFRKIWLTRYVRHYRSERKSVPHILVAERETQALVRDEADDEYDNEDYHPDRAWVATPIEMLHEDLDDAPDAQDLYYVSLLDCFARIQAQLRIPPPLAAVELLLSSQPISFPPDAAKARDKWRRVTQTSDPSPTQLACMDAESVLELVKLLTEGMSGIIRARVRAKIKRFGGWIWATLARCRDRGELSSEEIAELRELGKKAVKLLEFVRRTKSAEFGSEDGARPDVAIQLDEGEVAEMVEKSELEQAKTRMASVLDMDSNGDATELAKDEVFEDGGVEQEMDVSKLIHMVLDTVITVVGEVYGQRDLLEHRDIWE
jgi:hypothetical protein